MLNREGWNLLIILILFIVQMLLALPYMGKERSLTGRITEEYGWVQTALGTVLCASGPLLLAVIPAAAYSGGWLWVLSALLCAAGVIVLLLVIVPRLKRRGGYTLAQASASAGGPRMLFTGVASVSLVLLSVGAVSMIARVFAGVFSLHYGISLGAAAALCAVVSVLVSLRARKRVDAVQSAVLLLLLIGAPLAAIFLCGNPQNMTQIFRTENTGAAPETGAALTLLLGLLWGTGTLGLLLPAQRLMSAGEENAVKKGGIAASAGIAVLFVLAALTGFFGRFADSGLGTMTSAETVLIQITLHGAVPAPLAALFAAGIAVTLLLFVQSAWSTVSTWIAWDVLLPLRKKNTDGGLLLAADLIPAALGLLAFFLASNASQPLMWFAESGLLLGMVPAGMMIASACGFHARREGQWMGMIAGTLLAVVCLLLPVGRVWLILDAVPVLLCVLLPQILLRDRPEKAVLHTLADQAEQEKLPEEKNEQEEQKTGPVQETSEDVNGEAPAEKTEAADEGEAQETEEAEEETHKGE